MSSTPQERETYDVDLTREERWVAHHVLVRRADTVIDAEDVPPNWLVDLVEQLEADRDTITGRQARELATILDEYATAEETPDRDAAIALPVVETLEATVDA